jgi:hypothetical protein
MISSIQFEVVLSFGGQEPSAQYICAVRTAIQATLDNLPFHETLEDHIKSMVPKEASSIYLQEVYCHDGEFVEDDGNTLWAQEYTGIEPLYASGTWDALEDEDS